ncbi:MAG: site-specific DNA-methyltransferase [Chloroflexi bacterium]|nr:site-specific DNA-methyltransferase [Chloroflexota bacterium]
MAEPREPRARRAPTRTSAFGTAGRVNHDASAFYAGGLYSEVSATPAALAREVDLPDSARNRLFGHSSEQMTELPDNSVHLMVTSPPYNVGKEYDQNLTLADYRALLQRVLKETMRVLAPGGRACINIANLGRRPYIPVHSFIIEDALEMGLLMRGEIIWDKGAGAGPSTAWGSWRSATNPTLRDVHEYIMVFSKGSFSRQARGRVSTIERDEFLEYTKSVWRFAPESARKVKHPAPFPVELPRRLIQMYTFEGDVVLDPFMGVGSTAVAAVKTKRSYVGYELAPEYIAIAEERLRRACLEADFSNTAPPAPQQRSPRRKGAQLPPRRGALSTGG